MNDLVPRLDIEPPPRKSRGSRIEEATALISMPVGSSVFLMGDTDKMRNVLSIVRQYYGSIAGVYVSKRTVENKVKGRRIWKLKDLP